MGGGLVYAFSHAVDRALRRALMKELAGSRQVCKEHLDRPCETVAYPYGDTDDRVVAAAEAAGYLGAAALPTRFDRGGCLSGLASGSTAAAD